VLEAAKGGDDALARRTPVITEGFHDLHVGAAIGARDVNKHGGNYEIEASTLGGVAKNIVSLQKFRESAAEPLIRNAQGALWAA